ncbi:MAG: hypothetical protein A3F13_09890 [Gammaproteobacteria bacterium RIFCSPHIGHO2_12_FULL_40_19]|nr:MAG: hypothetical protein A3F13_09890 [Gammaproteobacteria bacterium RIFCSPHIGHO2_12_FULL_40_19]
MPYYNTQFIKGFALQPYLKGEDGLIYSATHGYNYWYIDGSLNTDFAETWDAERITRLREKCEKYDIKPIFHGNFKVPLASDVTALRIAAIEYTKHEIDVCEKLNCPLIIHGSVIVEPRKIASVKNEALNGLINSLIELKKYAKSKNVPLWLENLSNYPNYRPFTYIATSKDEFSYILDQVDIPIFFDIGHANVNAKNPVEEFFYAFHKNIVAISMSNNNGSLDQHLGLENGSIDYHNFVDMLLETKWSGIIAFETRNVSPRKSIQSLYSIIEIVNSRKSLRTG